MAKIEALSPNAATEPPLNVGSRNRFRSNIGWLIRHSTRTNAMSSTAAAARQPSTRLSVKDRWFDSISPYTRNASAAVNSAKPAQSGRLARGARDSATFSTEMTTAMTPIGAFTKKIHRQDRPDVSSPPSSGPMATATPVTAPQTPKATPRSLPRKASAKSARETANMMAPPTPCRPRDSWSISVLTAKPHSTDAAVKIARPIRYSRRRPYLSARLPAVSRNAARVSAYASTTHCRSEKLAFSARWMSGSATFTIVMSSSSMNVPRQTATSVHHLFPRWAGPGLLILACWPSRLCPGRPVLDRSALASLTQGSRVT